MNIGDLPRMNAGRAPDKVALTDAHGTTTCADLDARSNALANALLALGVEPRTNVAVLLTNRAEHVETLFALAKLGAPGVPMDPKWRSREIAAAFGFFDVTAVVAECSVAAELGRALADCPGWTGPVIWVGEPLPTGVARSHAYEMLIASAPTHAPDVAVRPDDVFLIMITSGTTGFPKGCLVTHQKYIYSCLNHGLDRGVGADDRELTATPLCFNSGRSSVFGHLFFGGSIILRDRFEPEDALATVERERVTYLAIAPVQADRLLQSPNVERYDLSSLRCLRKAGSPFHRKTLEGLIARVTPYVYQSYASTDAGTVTMLLPHEQLSHFGTSGRRIWAAEAQIVDEAGEPVPPGEVGEIVCRGPLVCAGYYKNPEANAASYRDGWLLTGDLGRFDEEGYLHVVGRRKHMIKSGSISIFPDEVQQALQSHPNVFEAAVIGVPSEEWGEAVTAVVALQPGASLGADELIAYCKTQLAAYKAPKQVEFVVELPHTELGKVATEVVRARFASRQAAGDAPSPPQT